MSQHKSRNGASTKPPLKDLSLLQRAMADRELELHEHKVQTLMTIRLPEKLTVAELGRTLSATSQDVINALKLMGHDCEVGTELMFDQAAEVANRIGFTVEGWDDDEDGLVPSILKTLSAYRGVSLQEIHEKLKKSNFGLEQIGQAVHKLVNEGVVAQFRLSGQRINVYTRKQGANMAAAVQTQSKSRKFDSNNNNLQGADPAGSIVLSQGIFVCVWKVMQDRKKRNIDEIAEILAAYGVNKEVTRDAVIKAKVNKGWFDWTGDGNATMMRLKKHIKMPTPVPTDPEQLKQKLTPGCVRESAPIVVNAEPAKTNSTTTFRERTDVQPQQDMPDAKSSKVVPISSQVAGALALAQAQGQNKLPLEEVAAPAAELTPVEKARLAVSEEVARIKAEAKIIRLSDGLPLAIWKAMSDYSVYSTGDVSMLLHAVGFNPNSVGSRLSSLHAKGWFDRTPIPGTRSFNYTLRRDVPMPEAPAVEGQEAQPEVKAPVAPAEPFTSHPALGEEVNRLSFTAPDRPVTAPIPETKKEETPAMSAQPASAPAPVANAPLVRCIVELKGIPFTFAEANVIARDLIDGGYAKPEAAEEQGEEMSSLFEVSIKIKGVPFSTEELREVAQVLTDNSFGMKLQNPDGTPAQLGSPYGANANGAGGRKRY